MKLLTAVSVLSTLTAQHFAADAASIIRSRQSASACGKINEQVAQYRQSNSSNVSRQSEATQRLILF